jgi:EAL and modified HD-GYP domain-containing signal transduction protein
MLPKDRVVIEILETIQMDQQVVECCHASSKPVMLSRSTISRTVPDWKLMVALANFIKVDLLTTAPEDQPFRPSPRACGFSWAGKCARDGRSRVGSKPA